MSIQLSKDYNIQGRELTVEVGRAEELDEGAIWAWEYRILVKGNLIEENLYRWDTNKRVLTNEKVANHLASFWSMTGSVVDAQEFPESIDFKLDKIVFKCADTMHEYFKQQDQDNKDFDILGKFMTEDGNEWSVILRPNYIRNRLVEFYQATPDNQIEVRTYIEDNEFSIEL